MGLLGGFSSLCTAKGIMWGCSYELGNNVLVIFYMWQHHHQS